MSTVNYSSDIKTLVNENEDFAEFFDEIESDFLDGDEDFKAYGVPEFIVEELGTELPGYEIEFSRDGNDVIARFQ